MPRRVGPMSLFATFDKVTQGVVETVLGDTFKLRAMRDTADVNAPRQSDLSRVDASFTGIYSDVPAPMNRPDAWDERADRRPGVVTRIQTIEVDPRRWPGVNPKRGDVIERADDGRRWRVTAATPDDMGRVLLTVETI